MTSRFEKRRWLRYSLRTLLVSVTALALLGGLVANQMHQREQMLARLRALPRLPGVALYLVVKPKPAPWTCPAAWLRPVHSIPLDARQVSKQEAERIRRLFPEAEVYFTYFL
jgi:hypothetical protein